MIKIDLDDLKNIALQIDEANTSTEYIRENAQYYSKSTYLAFKGVDEYLTTAVMLVEEIIKNESRD